MYRNVFLYLVERPLVQRPLTGVQDAFSSFVQRFRHVHVTLGTNNRQLRKT